MLSKSDIERQITHFTDDCETADDVKAIWLEALNWVLGDDAHQAKYDEWLRAIAKPLDDAPAAAGRELLLEHSLIMALLRLR